MVLKKDGRKLHKCRFLKYKIILIINNDHNIRTSEKVDLEQKMLIKVSQVGNGGAFGQYNTKFFCEPHPKCELNANPILLYLSIFLYNKKFLRRRCARKFLIVSIRHYHLIHTQAPPPLELKNFAGHFKDFSDPLLIFKNFADPRIPKLKIHFSTLKNTCNDIRIIKTSLQRNFG